MKADLWRDYGITPATLISGGVTIIDLAELVDQLPDGCSYKKEVGGYWAWTDSEKFLVAQEYQLRVSNWMNSKDGAKGRNRPKPLDPPMGRYEAEQKAEANEVKYASRIANFEEMEARRMAALEELENNDTDALEGSE